MSGMPSSTLPAVRDDFDPVFTRTLTFPGIPRELRPELEESVNCSARILVDEFDADRRADCADAVCAPLERAL